MILSLPSPLSRAALVHFAANVSLPGSDFWHTHPIKRFRIPKIRTSDGPNGVRGTRFFNGVLAACIPCGTGLGATWDRELVYEAGQLLGEECLAKGVHAWLGPTINIQRSPLGGRGFESYSEDPFLSGMLAASCINGLQSKGPSAVLKHFVPFSSGSACIFLASRTLYGLSQEGQAPKFFQKCNRFGTPYLAIAVSLLLTPLVYLSVASTPSIVFG